MSNVTNISAEANPHFTKIFNQTLQAIEFRKEWSDGKGRFTPAIAGKNAPKVLPGQIVKSITPGGRRVIFVGTRLGNLVVYDRFVGQQPGEKNVDCAVISRDASSALEQGGWFAEPVFDEFEIELALGIDGQPNLGQRIEQLFANLKMAA